MLDAEIFRHWSKADTQSLHVNSASLTIRDNGQSGLLGGVRNLSCKENYCTT